MSSLRRLVTSMPRRNFSAASAPGKDSEMLKWKHRSWVGLPLVFAVSAYIMANDEHPTPGDKPYKHLNIRNSAFPWGNEPLIGIPKHDEHH